MNPSTTPATSSTESSSPRIRTGRAMAVASGLAVLAGLLIALFPSGASATTVPPLPITTIPPIAITPVTIIPIHLPPIHVIEGCPTTTGHRATVRWAFITVLNRCPDAGAFTYWSGWLDTHSTVDLVGTLAQSAENRQRYVNGFFLSILHRRPTPSESTTWMATMASSNGSLSSAAPIFGSAEFFSAVGSSNSVYIAATYHLILGRAVDSGAAAYWAGNLAAGGSRTAMAYNLLTSTEFAHKHLSQTFAQMMQRTIDAGGLTYWTSRYVPADAEFTMLRNWASSPEFDTVAQSQPDFIPPLIVVG